MVGHFVAVESLQKYDNLIEFLMKTVWCSEPVISGLLFPISRRSSSTGHQDRISHTDMAPYFSGLSVGMQRPVWGP